MINESTYQAHYKDPRFYKQFESPAEPQSVVKEFICCCKSPSNESLIQKSVHFPKFEAQTMATKEDLCMMEMRNKYLKKMTEKMKVEVPYKPLRKDSQLPMTTYQIDYGKFKGTGHYPEINLKELFY